MTGAIDPLAARLAQLVKAQGQAGAVNAGNPPPSFENMLSHAIRDTVETSRAAEATAMRGVIGEASVREVVEAVTQAELGLQTASAVRDRVIAAYQDIIRMPI
jgi:flagellar hook-basal body complex protein FliE